MTPHRKKSPHVVQFVPRDWFETNSQHQKLNATLKAAKKIEDISVYWKEQ